MQLVQLMTCPGREMEIIAGHTVGDYSRDERIYIREEPMDSTCCVYFCFCCGQCAEEETFYYEDSEFTHTNFMAIKRGTLKGGRGKMDEDWWSLSLKFFECWLNNKIGRKVAFNQINPRY